MDVLHFFLKVIDQALDLRLLELSGLRDHLAKVLVNLLVSQRDLVERKVLGQLANAKL